MNNFLTDVRSFIFLTIKKKKSSYFLCWTKFAWYIISSWRENALLIRLFCFNVKGREPNLNHVDRVPYCLTKTSQQLPIYGSPTSPLDKQVSDFIVLILKSLKFVHNFLLRFCSISFFLRKQNMFISRNILHFTCIRDCWPYMDNHNFVFLREWRISLLVVSKHLARSHNSRSQKKESKISRIKFGNDICIPPNVYDQYVPDWRRGD